MKQRTKRILAITAIVLIVAMYVIAFVLSFSENENTQKMFTASIVCTIAIPLFLYVFIWFSDMVKRGNAVPEDDPAETGSEEDAGSVTPNGSEDDSENDTPA